MKQIGKVIRSNRSQILMVLLFTAINIAGVSSRSDKPGLTVWLIAILIWPLIALISHFGHSKQEHPHDEA